MPILIVFSRAFVHPLVVGNQVTRSSALVQFNNLFELKDLNNLARSLGKMPSWPECRAPIPLLISIKFYPNLEWSMAQTPHGIRKTNTPFFRFAPKMIYRAKVLTKTKTKPEQNAWALGKHDSCKGLRILSSCGTWHMYKTSYWMFVLKFTTGTVVPSALQLLVPRIQATFIKYLNPKFPNLRARVR